MPKTKISEYSATANSNTDVASINIDEGCAPSGINNAIRAVMGHLKDFQQGTNGDPFNGPVNGTVGATTPSTGAFTTLSASSTVTLSGGTANGVAYLNGSKVLTTGSALTFDGSALSVSASVASATLASSGAYSALSFTNSGGAAASGTILANSSGILQSRAATHAYTNADASSEYMRISGATGGVGAVGIGYSSLTSVGNNGLAVLGNVGIGTSSPGYKLDVLGNVNRFAGANVDGIFLSTVAATDTSYYGANYYNNNGTEGVNASGRASWRIATVTSGSPTFSIGYRAASAGAGVFSTPLTIDSSGNLMIGGTGYTNKRVSSIVPASWTGSAFYGEAQTSFTGGVYFSVTATAAGTGWYHMVCQSSGGTNNLLIFGNGNVQNANNSYGAISDAKLKENIVDATPKLEKLMQVRIRNYNLKGEYEQHKQIGVVAQELEQVFPSMVEESPDKDADGNDLGTVTKSVKYSVFVPMLIKALQEQQAIIQSLTARITALEGA